MTRHNEAMLLGLLMSLWSVQSCISAEDPKAPAQNSRSGVGGTVTGQGGTAASTGGTGHTGGAEPGTGGVATAAGGELATGGRQATGGFVSAEGGAPPNTGGSASNGGCDFGSPSCAAPCDTFATSPATSWKQAPCEALIVCLKDKVSCISAADPLCGPQQAPSYAAPACGDAYYNAASDSEISTALTTHVKCICGF